MGVGVVDAGDEGQALVYSGVLEPERSNSLPERLYHLYVQLVRLMEDHEPSAIAVEQPFVARNVRAAMAVGQAQAVAMMAGAQYGLPVFSYAPREIKRAVTDYGGSSKEQVQEMVRVLLGLPHPPEPSDAADALATAICHISASRVDELVVRD